MNTMVDALINGDDCEECGVYLGGGHGFPRLCDACSFPEKGIIPPFDKPEDRFDLMREMTNEKTAES